MAYPYSSFFRQHNGAHPCDAASSCVARNTPRRTPFSLTAAALLCLFLAACATTQPHPEAPDTPETKQAVIPAPPATTHGTAPIGAQPETVPAKQTPPATRQSKKPPVPHKVMPPSATQLRANMSRPFAGEGDVVFRVPDAVWAGEPFIVAVQAQGLTSMEAAWRGKRIQVRAGAKGQDSDVCQILFSVPLDDKTSHYPLQLTLHDAQGAITTTADIAVRNRKYPVQKLTVSQKYVTPDPSVQAQIKRDRKILSDTLGKISPEKYWSPPFVRPVPGTISSVYGLRRVFNGQPRNPHKGLDFRAKQGDPIAAIETGRVVLVDDMYYGGQTVVVDHGLGLFSLYLHLSAFNVTPGQMVQRGETVGFIGSTGRSTGPHLHLSLSVLGTSVNAAPLIEGMGSEQQQGGTE